MHILSLVVSGSCPPREAPVEPQLYLYVFVSLPTLHPLVDAKDGFVECLCAHRVLSGTQGTCCGRLDHVQTARTAATP